MRKLMLVAALAAVAAFVAPASAQNLLVNGDFSAGSTGWTNWAGGWGSLAVSTSSGAASISGTGSGGLYQVINATPGSTVTLTGDWNGTVTGGNGWIEIMLFNVYNSDGINTADPGAMTTSYLDYAEWPAPTDSATPDAYGRIGINQRDVNKRDAWGLGEVASGQFQNNLVTGNGGTPLRGNFMGTNQLVVGPDGKVCVAVKAGSSGAGIGPVTFDNLVLTPEPATMALLGLGGLALLRRRR